MVSMPRSGPSPPHPRMPRVCSAARQLRLAGGRVARYLSLLDGNVPDEEYRPVCSRAARQAPAPVRRSGGRANAPATPSAAPEASLPVLQPVGNVGVTDGAYAGSLGGGHRVMTSDGAGMTAEAATPLSFPAAPISSVSGLAEHLSLCGGHRGAGLPRPWPGPSTPARSRAARRARRCSARTARRASHCTPRAPRRPRRGRPASPPPSGRRARSSSVGSTHPPGARTASWRHLAPGRIRPAGLPSNVPTPAGLVLLWSTGGAATRRQARRPPECGSVAVGPPSVRIAANRSR